MKTSMISHSVEGWKKFKKRRANMYLSIAKKIFRSISKDDHFICKYLEKYKSEHEEFNLFNPLRNKFVGDGWFSESCVISKLYTESQQKIVKSNEARINALLFCMAMVEDEHNHYRHYTIETPKYTLESITLHKKKI